MLGRALGAQCNGTETIIFPRTAISFCHICSSRSCHEELSIGNLDKGLRNMKVSQGLDNVKMVIAYCTCLNPISHPFIKRPLLRP